MAVKHAPRPSRALRCLARILTRKKLTLSVCESCTSGMFGSLITSIPGSSKYFLGGIIAYSDRVKNKVVGVRTRTLERHGAVSAETVLEMAQGVRRIFRSDIGIAITGIAGPSGGSKEKPVGLTFIGLRHRQKNMIRHFVFEGGRAAVRQGACQAALNLILSYLA
jgi:PncC family amidohydrolase